MSKILLFGKELKPWILWYGLGNIWIKFASLIYNLLTAVQELIHGEILL